MGRPTAVGRRPCLLEAAGASLSSGKLEARGLPPRATSMTSTPASIDRISGRTGLSGDAVAILMILAGVLVIVFPAILRFTVGGVLIALGVLFFVSRHGRRALPPP